MPTSLHKKKYKKAKRAQTGITTGSSSIDSILEGILGGMIPSSLGDYVGGIASQRADQRVAAGQQAATDRFAELIGSSLGIDPEIVKGAGSNIFGQIFLEEMFRRQRDAAEAAGGGGAADSALGYANLAESARQFDITAAQGREAAVADLLSTMIATEINRKGTQAELGGQLLGMFMEAVGIAAPKNMNVIPGFEPGGIAEKLSRGYGYNAADTLRAARSPERVSIPFSKLDQQIADIPGVRELEPSFRELAASYFSEAAQAANIPSGPVGGGGGLGASFGGAGGGSAVSGGGAAAISSAPTHARDAGPQITEGVAKTVSNYLSSPVTKSSPASDFFPQQVRAIAARIGRVDSSLPVKTIVTYRDAASPEEVRATINFLSSKYANVKDPRVKSRLTQTLTLLRKKFGETSKTSTSTGRERGAI